MQSHQTRKRSRGQGSHLVGPHPANKAPQPGSETMLQHWWYQRDGVRFLLTLGEMYSICLVCHQTIFLRGRAALGTVTRASFWMSGAVGVEVIEGRESHCGPGLERWRDINPSEICGHRSRF